MTAHELTSHEPSNWTLITQQNPNHSQWYIERFRQMAASGADLDGEARLIDAMLPRGSRVLDAGSGPGRVAGRLHELGHQVVGVDVDPKLIEAAEQDHPGPRYAVCDLTDLDLGEQFDAIVCAGNVMTFCAASTRPEIVRRFAAHLADGGRAVIGFGAGRGYEFSDFFADVESAGLRPDLLLSTWDLRPFREGDTFLVAVLAKA